MSKQALINGIEKVIGNNYSIWTIGITNEPARRKREHKSDGKTVDYWRDWSADTESIARSVEKHFLDKGCKGGGGGGTTPTFVYVF